jgi:hypothetical protein
LPSMLPAPPKPCAQAVTRRTLLSQKSLAQSWVKAKAVRVPPSVVVLRASDAGCPPSAWPLARAVAVWPNTVPRNWPNTPNAVLCGAVATSPVSCARMRGELDASRLP